MKSEEVISHINENAEVVHKQLTQLYLGIEELVSLANDVKGIVLCESDSILTSISTAGKVINAGLANSSARITNSFQNTLNGIKDEVISCFEKQSVEDAVSGTVEKAYDTALALLLQVIENIGGASNPSKKVNTVDWPNPDGGGPLALPAPSEVLSLPAPMDDVDDNGLIFDSTVGDLLGDAAEGGGLTSMFSNLSAVVSEAGQKMWEFGSAISTAFSNFGSSIAQLAASTGTWIANTAAKVGNTAAQWAQIAATTAWQAICTAATAVTTAFGAAMTFLTSPIGLVVLAIVALIAIIALLIANWDTVKTAVLNAWETIKGALATAGNWINTNVIQPVVGFFNTAFQWVSTKLQAGFAFVQSIFAGVSSFMQGVFAGDCRFPEVLFENRISES